MATERIKAVRIPDDAPLPDSPKDLARAIFRDAAGKRKARLAKERAETASA